MLTCQGILASRATFWRPATDGKSLHQFGAHALAGTEGNSPARGVPIASLPARVLQETGVRIWRRGIDSGFDALAEMLCLSASCRRLLLLPVRIASATPSLLCVEFSTSDCVFTADAEVFLRLAAARVEIAVLAEASGAHGNGDRSTGSAYPLQQSHLTLTEENLRDLFYFAPTAMLLTTPEARHPIAANRHALALFDVSAQNSENLRTCDLWLEPDEREAFVRQVLSDGFVRGHRAQMRKTNGTHFWARISATAIDYDGRPALMSSVTDVSDTVAAEEILNRTQRTLATLLEASPFPLVVTRLDTGVVRYCNRRAADMFETPFSGLIGRTAPEFYVNPADREEFVEKLRNTGKVDDFVAQLKTRSGQPFWAMLSAKTLELNDEPVFMVAFADMTRHKNKEEELEGLAFRDVLTDAYNRRYFVEATQIELARSARNAKFPVLALLDIDHFKRINDTWGHEAGDGVLREFATLVSGLLRKTDILARYGGEEFAILFPETDTAAAHDIVERIRLVVNSHAFSCHAGNISVTFSAGLAASAADGDYQSVIAGADQALYIAKRAGRDCVRVADFDRY